MKRNRTVIMIICLVQISFYSFAQGGWDIDYITIDSLSITEIGRDVKIDFKNTSSSIDKGKPNFMYFISKQDTGSLELDGEIIEFVEQRNIHLDWGFYDEQFLESVNYSDNKIIRIYHTIIEEITSDSVLFRVYLETYSRGNKGGIKDDLQARRRCEKVWINRTKLDGVMVK